MPAFGINNVGLGVVFIIFAIQCLLLTRQVNERRKSESNEESKAHFREGVYNGVLTAAIMVAIGLIYIITGLGTVLFNNNVQAGIELLYPVPTDSFAIYFLAFLVVFIGAFVIYEYITEANIKNPPPERKIHKLDLEVSRKAFHVLIIGILAVYLVVGPLVTKSLYEYLSDPVYDLYGYATANLSVIDSGQLWAMFGVTAVFEFSFLTDLIRIKAPRWYPARMISNMYREKEKETLGPHIYLVAGILFAIIIFPAPIAMAVIAVSGLGDATATIVGVTKGKHKIRPKLSKKSWEGSIAGMIASFVFGFIAFIALAFLPAYNVFSGDISKLILTGVVVNAVAVPVFFAIDYFTPSPLPFSDNLLNPVLIGFTMWGVYSLCVL
jgi:dolichol kinase